MLGKGEAGKIEIKVELPDSIEAPVQKGDKIGKILFLCNGETVGECDAVADASVDRIGFGEVFFRMIKSFFTSN